MGISRRQFLINTAGAAIGAILPDFYIRALQYFEVHESALLIPPDRVSQDLVVANINDYDELFLGDPWEEPPSMTWREFLTRYCPAELDSPGDYFELLPGQLDEEAEFELVADNWLLHDGPSARAYQYLESLDLRLQDYTRNTQHGLDFIRASNMVSEWPVVRPRSEVSLSLLQQRLNDLQTGVRVVMG
jgi:hypothetical protein